MRAPTGSSSKSNKNPLNYRVGGAAPTTTVGSYGPGKYGVKGSDGQSSALANAARAVGSGLKSTGNFLFNSSDYNLPPQHGSANAAQPQKSTQAKISKPKAPATKVPHSAAPITTGGTAASNHLKDLTNLKSAAKAYSEKLGSTKVGSKPITSNSGNGLSGGGVGLVNRPAPTGNGTPGISPAVAGAIAAKAGSTGSGATPTIKLAAGATAYKNLLQDLGKQYWGNIDDNTLNYYANKIAASKGKLLDHYKQEVINGGATKDELALAAGNSVKAELDPQIDAIAQRILDSQKQNALTQSGLDQIGKHLQGFNSDITNMTNQNFAQNQQALDQNYGAAQNAVNSGYNQANQSTNDELSRLGIQAAAPAATANLNRDQQYMNGLISTDKANNQSLQNAQQQSAQFLLNQLGAEGQQSVAGWKNAGTQALNQQLNDLNANKDMLTSSRAAKVNTALTQLEQMNSALSHQYAQQNFQNSLDLSKQQAASILAAAQAGMYGNQGDYYTAYAQKLLQQGNYYNYMTQRPFTYPAGSMVIDPYSMLP